MEPVEISHRAAGQVARGNHWIFSNEIVRKPASATPGDWCTFECRGTVIGTGYINPHSLIFGRVVSRQPAASIPELLKSRLRNAFAFRAGLAPDGAARLVYSESDFLPGLNIDVYSDNAVLQSNTAGIDRVMGELETLVPEVYKAVFGRKLKGLVVRADTGIRQLEGVEKSTRVSFGDAEGLEHISFSEAGTHFVANLVKGQKTGFFLDQKDNRSFLNKIFNREGLKMLDLCCYTGGWGLRALRSGASRVTFVDESKDALALVEEGLRRNDFKDKAQLVSSDVFDFLEKDQKTYDVIVADPPAFVKSKKNLPQAKRAYEKLNRLAWRRLAPGGILITCSCSYHIGESDFLDLLQQSVGKESGEARIVFHGGQASDHPILLAMPETRYLKCFGLKKGDGA